MNTAKGHSIPRFVHRIWLGGRVPEQDEENWDQWQRLFPGWEFLTWNEADLERLGMPSGYYTAPTFAEKSDVARYELAFKVGGIYTDCDVRPLSCFDWLFASGIRVVAFEFEPAMVMNGLFATTAWNTPFRLARHLARKSARAQPLEAAPNVRTGPFVLSVALSYARSIDPTGILIYPRTFVDTGLEEAPHAIARTLVQRSPIWQRCPTSVTPAAAQVGIAERARAAQIDLRLFPVRARRAARSIMSSTAHSAGAKKARGLASDDR